MRRINTIGAIAVLLAGWAYGQTPPTTRPAADLSTPATALASYFRAEQAIDLRAINQTLAVTQASKQPYVDVVLNFRLWRHYLERQAIRRFGKEAGGKVEGHARTLDDQLALDLNRLKEATVEPNRGVNGAPDTAKVFLLVEPGRPEGLQSDRFDYLDTFYLVKTAEGWKVDFLRTYDCLATEKEPTLKFEAGIFPIMANAFKDLAEGLNKGDFATADSLKAAIDDRWLKAYTYGTPTDAATATTATAPAEMSPPNLPPP